MKPTSTKALLLALLVLVGAIVSPVSALGYELITPWYQHESSVEKVSNLTVDLSTDGNALQRIVIDLGTGTSVNFTLWYGSGESVSGWMAYRNSTDCWGWLSGEWCQYSGVSIGTDVQGGSNRGPQEIGRMDVVLYARNWTSEQNYTRGYLVYDTVYALPEGHQAYFPVANGTDILVYKFNVVSTNPVNINWNFDTRSTVANQITTTRINQGNDWLAIAGKYASSAIAFIAGLFWILKFFFIDNLLLIIALWISVSMAYSAITSPNIWGFYKKFFRTQKVLLDFVVALWTTLWSIINYLVQIFVKWL